MRKLTVRQKKTNEARDRLRLMLPKGTRIFIVPRGKTKSGFYHFAPYYYYCGAMVPLIEKDQGLVWDAFGYEKKPSYDEIRWPTKEVTWVAELGKLLYNDEWAFVCQILR